MHTEISQGRTPYAAAASSDWAPSAAAATSSSSSAPGNEYEFESESSISKCGKLLGKIAKSPGTLTQWIGHVITTISKTAGDTIETIGQTAAGVFGTLQSIATLGKVPKINDVADKTERAYKLLPTIYSGIIKTLGSDRVIPNVEETRSLGACTPWGNIPFFIAVQSAKDGAEFTRRGSRVKGFIVGHVISRTLSALSIGTATITRIVDLIFGLGAAVVGTVATLASRVVPIVTCGRITVDNERVKQVNEFAMKQLSFCGLLQDICAGVRGIINPHQFNLDADGTYPQWLEDRNEEMNGATLNRKAIAEKQAAKAARAVKTSSSSRFEDTQY